MSFTVTNQRSSQAERGQSVTIFLNAADSAQLSNMTLGEKCTVSTNTGYIDFIDLYGHQFRVKPDMPTNSFIGVANLSYLASGTSITVG
jgi:hypothetical protein